MQSRSTLQTALPFLLEVTMASADSLRNSFTYRKWTPWALPLRTYQEKFSTHTRFCPQAQPTRACCEDLAYPKSYKPETISGLYSTAEHQPRGASTRSTARTSSKLYSTARGCSRLCSTARRCSRLYGSADTSIYWRPLIEKLALSASVPVFHRRTVVALAF